MAAPDAPDESTSRMGPYDVLEQIGKGAFGAAWIIQTRGNDSNPPRRFVLKKIPLARLSERQRHLSLQERQLVAALRHPYIVPYHRSWIERSHTVCIVMRHCDGGDLASAAWRARRRRERFPEQTLRRWLAQLLSALAYLHSERVIHRDVKCGNVFLASPPGFEPGTSHAPTNSTNSWGDVMLGDFGLARVVDANAADDVQATSTVGTPHFMSPEMLRGAKYGFAADVWSLGCVMYELTTLRQPFTAFNMEGLRRKILTSPPAAFIQPGKEGEEDASLYGDGWRATIRSMLRKAPEERPSASELLRTSDMADAAADADARAREIEAAAEAERREEGREEEEGGEDGRGDGAGDAAFLAAPDREPMPAPGGDWSPSADERSQPPGRSSVRRGWADLDPSYMRFNPQRKPRPPPRPQSARPARASTGAPRNPATETGQKQRAAATPATQKTAQKTAGRRPGWNASPRVRPASGGPLGRPASAPRTPSSGDRAAARRASGVVVTGRAVTGRAVTGRAASGGGADGSDGFDPYAPVAAEPASALAPKHPADENEAPNNTDETPSKSRDEAPSWTRDEAPSRDDVVARARRLLAETSPKLAAPSPIARHDGTDDDADDSRVLRAVAALHARGRHAELARVLSNFYPPAEAIPPTPSAPDLEPGQCVMVGASSPTRGTIRYVGAVAFAEGEWVGVEMDDEGVGAVTGRAVTGRDGRVGAIQYFACRPGRGVFVPAATLTRA